MRLLIVELSHSSGTRTVLRHIVPRFASQCQAVFYCGHDSVTWKRVPRIEAFSFGELVAHFLTWRDRLQGLLKEAKTKDEAIWSLIDRFIVHNQISHVFLPWVVGQPIPRLSVSSGAMVMDLLWRHFPDEFLANHNLERTFLENLRNVDVVFPVSDATAAEMASAFDLSGINVVSVPHGAELPLAEDEGLAMPTDLPSNFFLYPAQITENKNHVCLFEAVRILAGQGAVCSLVCTSRAISRLRNGTITSSYEKRLRRWLDVNEDLLDSHIDLRGEVAWLELETLYRGCNAVILPSFYEGFGLPLVEAFKFNAPVICSEITPFREQVKRYGMEDRTIWVDPMTPKALANTMLAVLEKPRSLPLPYSELTHRLGMWTWDDAVRVYLKNLEVA